MTRSSSFGTYRRPTPRPLSAARARALNARLEQLNADPLKRHFNDREYQDYVLQAFETAHPPEAETRDPVNDLLPTFQPTAWPRDVLPEAAVGPGQANQPGDVVGAKRAMSALGAYHFDVSDEASTAAGSGFVNAVRRFQKANGLTADGILQPGGPTLQVIAAKAFPGEGLEERVKRAAIYNPCFADKPPREPDAHSAASGLTPSNTSKASTGLPPGSGGGDLQLAEATPDPMDERGDPSDQAGTADTRAGQRREWRHDWGRIIDDLLEREGGFNDDDPSNFGILDDTLRDHRARQGEELTDGELREELENLTEGEATDIYEGIVDRHRLDEVPDQDLAEQLFDAIVNHGPGNANEWLQEALNETLQRNEADAIAVDGVIGDETLEALLEAAHRGLIDELRDDLVQDRVNFIRGLGFGDALEGALVGRAERFRP